MHILGRASRLALPDGVEGSGQSVAITTSHGLGMYLLPLKPHWGLHPLTYTISTQGASLLEMRVASIGGAFVDNARRPGAHKAMHGMSLPQSLPWGTRWT